jgi:CO/xanthine dehydrogenase FAD-binding subunit
MRPFRYERPTTLAEAIALLSEEGTTAAPLAGGTDLIINLRDGSTRPDVVVDIKGIADLDQGILVSGDRLVIGSLAVVEDIALDATVRQHFAALAEAAAVVGSVQIRNRATLAGNICNASPAADTVPALIVFDATVATAGPRGKRRIPIDDFLRGPGATALERGELVTAIELPIPGVVGGSTHVRRTRRRGHDLASITLAARVTADGQARLAYGSVGPRPVLAVDDSGVLGDPMSSLEARAAALEPLFAGASPSARSMRAGPAYRLAMLRVLALRAVATAHERLARVPA